MKQNLINLAVIISVLAITGIIRMPYEQDLSDELLENKLIPTRLNLESRLALKQKGFASGFGSLRPTIAAFLNLAASNDHSDQDWEGLEKKYDDILMLDPHNTHYWEMASWHLISNAAGDVRNNEELPYLTQHKLFNEYIDKGETIIERGIVLNSDNYRINALSPNHYASRFRRPNYEKAAAEYIRVSQMHDVPRGQQLLMKRLSLYCLNKVPDRHQEAYELALQLFEDSPDNHVPSLLTSVWVGQNNPLNTVKSSYTLEQIFGSDEKAYAILVIQWKYKNQLEEKHGIEGALKKLEKQLRIPQKSRIFPHRPMFMK